MVVQRESLIQQAHALAELVLEGGGSSTAARNRASKILQIGRNGGTYTKQYDNHEQRVLYRHLNLYRNKLEKATSAKDIAHWTKKLEDHKLKMAGRAEDLDLDGL